MAHKIVVQLGTCIMCVSALKYQCTTVGRDRCKGVYVCESGWAWVIVACSRLIYQKFYKRYQSLKTEPNSWPGMRSENLYLPLTDNIMQM